VSESVLVVGPSWVGDMVIAQSLFISLRLHDPAISIDVVAPDWSRPVVTRMPEVREAIGLPIRHGRLALATRWRVGRALSRRGYDRAIVLPQSLKSALVPFFAGIPRRTGFLGEHRHGLINDVRPLHRSDGPMVLRYLSLGLPPGSPAPGEAPRPRLRVDETNRRALVARLELDLARPVVVCVPGAEYGPAKAWPAESFADLGRRIAASGFAVWVVGSEADRRLGERIRSAAGAGARDLCGRTSLEDAVDLLSLAHVVVSNDSGLMHVAAAVGRPIVAVFGSSSPTYTPPLAGRAEVLYLGLDCSPCFERRCPLGHYDCLRGIGVDAVLDATRRLA
jgi:heptosyltransferase-2